MKKLKDILKEFESGADQLKRMRANQSIHRSEEERLGIDPFRGRGKTYDPKTGSFSRKKRPKKTLVDMYFDQTNNGKNVDIKRLKGKVKKLIMTFLKDMGYDAKFSDMFGAGLQNYIQKNKWPKGRKLYADEIIVLKYFMGWYEKNYDIEVQPGGMNLDVNPFRTYMQDFMHTTSESKMNLGKKYKQLFEGKPMSNDASLITEAVSNLKHRYNEDGILVISGKMGGTPFEVETGGPQGSEKPGISGHKGSWTVSMEEKTRSLGRVLRYQSTIDNDDIKPELTLAIQRYVKQKGLSWQSGKVQPSDDTPKGNILKNKDFRDAVETIADGAGDGENMTDDIVDELGDFYDGVYDSNDQKLIDAFDNLRSTVDGEPNDQAEAANKLLDVIG